MEHCFVDYFYIEGNIIILFDIYMHVNKSTVILKGYLSIRLPIERVNDKY